jgi:excisionase family DNA binding protein
MPRSAEDRAIWGSAFKPALLSINDARKKLNVSRSTLYKLAREGKLEIKRLGPKLSRVTAESIDRLLNTAPSFTRGSPIKTLTPEERERRNAEADAELAKLGL